MAEAESLQIMSSLQKSLSMEAVWRLHTRDILSFQELLDRYHSSGGRWVSCILFHPFPSIWGGCGLLPLSGPR